MERDSFLAWYTNGAVYDEDESRELSNEHLPAGIFRCFSGNRKCTSVGRNRQKKKNRI